ncbi:hypothetical protein GGX14DRAFT_316420, partial [Mycena pura]
EMKQRVVAMHYHLHSPHEHIALALKISVRSVENILHELRTTGQLRPPGHSSEHILGRPRILDAVDVDFLVWLIQQTPDLYVEELQEELWVVRAVDACERTIVQALKRRGFTRKRVR